MTPEVTTYLKSIADKEDYTQLMQDLVCAAIGSGHELVLERAKCFCEDEIVHNISFMVTVAKQKVELEEEG